MKDPNIQDFLSSESRKKTEYEIGDFVAGRFRIIEELGRGGCGIVYQVEFKENEKRRIAAMKTEVRRPGFNDTLAAEINILNKLRDSDYFCKLITYGRISDINVVVMSLVGPSLSWLRRRCPQQRFSISTSLRIGYQCLIVCFHISTFNVYPHISLYILINFRLLKNYTTLDSSTEISKLPILLSDSMLLNPERSDFSTSVSLVVMCVFFILIF